MLLRIFCMLLLVFAALNAAGQQHKRFGLAYRYGYLLTHHQELTDAYGGTNPSMVEFTWLKPTTGEKEWHRVWNYPDVGINVAWINTGNAELGNTYYTTVFLQKYIGDRDKDFQLSFKVAPGISYTTKRYSVEENETNTFISTHVNMIMEGNFLAHYRVSPQWNAFGGIVFTHFSNGGVKLPNSGFNIPSLTLGMIYKPNPTPLERNKETVEPLKRHVRYNVMYGASVKSKGEDTNDLGFAWTLSGYAHWRLNYRSALTGGLDLFYNSTIPDRVENPDANQYRVGLHAGHDLIAGTTSMLFQVGYYIYRPEDVDKSFYWRLGVKQHISDKLFAGFFLKAHLGRADLIEWGLGYRL